ncbi:hypothetical protein [Amphritea balenae]|uniref:Uncharacterized protein n=1 Tax=Amphritea balenae TaxID=452629 RepID=A0A3P1SMX1_9GAMM|nr:hypothetical protein [Amphritea balenae]RRC98601.1 hypothetical protein EHS89_13400 [Amphritea balenae]GGK65839.1 hypothetical protein GCM10007941_15070 [Amphritea balenae]
MATRGLKRFRSRQKGSASIELIIGSLAAIPLFFGISILGKYADMRHKTVEATRYVVWENVIWPGGREKSAIELELESTDRFMGHRKAPIINYDNIETSGVTEDPLWRDHKTRTLMVSDGSTVRVNVVKKQRTPIKHNAAVRTMAYKGTLFGLDLDLSPAYLSTYSVSMPISDRVRNPKQSKPSTLAGFFNPNNYEQVRQLSLNASGGILTDNWIASDEADYKKTTEGLVAEKLVKVVVVPGTETFGQYFPFQEGKHGSKTDFVANSSKVLSEYIQK